MQVQAESITAPQPWQEPRRLYGQQSQNTTAEHRTGREIHQHPGTQAQILPPAVPTTSHHHHLYQLALTCFVWYGSQPIPLAVTPGPKTGLVRGGWNR